MAHFGAGVDGDDVFNPTKLTRQPPSGPVRLAEEGTAPSIGLKRLKETWTESQSVTTAAAGKSARAKDWLLGFDNVMSGGQHFSTVPALIFRVHRNARLPACQKVRLCYQKVDFHTVSSIKYLQSGSDQIGIAGNPQHKIVRPSLPSGCR